MSEPRLITFEMLTKELQDELRKATKHSTVFTDSDDAEYYNSSARYGRCNVNSREYLFDGKTYKGNNGFVQREVDMVKAGYNQYNVLGLEAATNQNIPEEILKGLKEVYEEAEEVAKKLMACVRAETNDLRNMGLEAMRLNSLKSQRSHNKSAKIWEEAKERSVTLNSTRVQLKESLDNQYDLKFIIETNKNEACQNFISNGTLPSKGSRFGYDWTKPFKLK